MSHFAFQSIHQIRPKSVCVCVCDMSSSSSDVLSPAERYIVGHQGPISIPHVVCTPSADQCGIRLYSGVTALLFSLCTRISYMYIIDAATCRVTLDTHAPNDSYRWWAQLCGWAKNHPLRARLEGSYVVLRGRSWCIVCVCVLVYVFCICHYRVCCHIFVSVCVI